jgi:hypothetical protein
MTDKPLYLVESEVTIRSLMRLERELLTPTSAKHIGDECILVHLDANIVQKPLLR